MKNGWVGGGDEDEGTVGDGDDGNLRRINEFVAVVKIWMKTCITRILLFHLPHHNAVIVGKQPVHLKGIVNLCESKHVLRRVMCMWC